MPSASNGGGVSGTPTGREEETYSMEQVLYENVELRRPLSEERLEWLLNRIELLEAVARAAGKGPLGTEPELDEALEAFRRWEGRGGI